jgi:hypothetical protein
LGSVQHSVCDLLEPCAASERRCGISRRRTNWWGGYVARTASSRDAVPSHRSLRAISGTSGLRDRLARSSFHVLAKPI